MVDYILTAASSGSCLLLALIAVVVINKNKD